MPKLPKAPLQEAIFEIRWELDVDPSNNQPLDLGFSLAQGKLQEIVKDEFPVYKRRVPHGLPDHIFQFQPINQYWRKDETWPVLQLGPGIFSINDTDKNYDWNRNYFPLIQRGLEWVLKAYDKKLPINSASLRYIDSVMPKNYGYEGKLQEFIQQHFKFSFVNDFEPGGSVRDIQFDQFFQLTDGSSLHIAMTSGKYRKTEEEALIWQTAVIKQDNFEIASLLNWVEKSHTITSDLFRRMTKQDFYDSFK